MNTPPFLTLLHQGTASISSYQPSHSDCSPMRLIATDIQRKDQNYAHSKLNWKYYFSFLLYILLHKRESTFLMLKYKLDQCDAKPAVAMVFLMLCFIFIES